MPIKNTREQWGTISKALHWVVVALILVMAWIGLRMGDMANGPDKIASYALHKSVGITILALVLARMALVRRHPRRVARHAALAGAHRLADAPGVVRIVAGDAVEWLDPQLCLGLPAAVVRAGEPACHRRQGPRPA